MKSIWIGRKFIMFLMCSFILILIEFCAQGCYLAANSLTNEAETGFLANVYTVAPHVLVLYLEDGWLEPWRQIPYDPKPGDEVVDGKLMRDRIDAGYFLRDLQGNAYVALPETRIGQAFDRSALLAGGSYTLHSTEDANYQDYINPVKVYLKNKPVAAAVPSSPQGNVGGYWVYLEFENPLKQGATYSVRFQQTGVSPGSATFTYDSKSYVSEAIHVGQVGVFPDAKQKQAFLSLWMGDGGGLVYNGISTFELIDENGDSRYTGDVALHWPLSQEETLSYGITKNFNYTDVYRMDFSDFKTPGVYRVHVPGVGTSYPFEIGKNIWIGPFTSVMKGFYSQRSGIEKGQPYTDYTAPRAFHPDDGFVVYHMNMSIIDSPANKMSPANAEMSVFEAVSLYATDITVPDAWGGYFDAGDWTVRAEHLKASMLQLELLQMAPEFFGNLDLNIPESGNGMPDILNEALWNIDLYKRMQTADGGIRGGIEFTGVSPTGETSWTSTMKAYAYAPDHWSSYIYAAAALRAAAVMKQFGCGDPSSYCESAKRAFEWAEAAYADWLTPYIKEGADPNELNRIEADRALAAIELYRFTGDSAYHDIFTGISYVQTVMFREPASKEPAAAYLMLPEDMRDREVYDKMMASLIQNADWNVNFAASNAFGIVNSHKWARMQWGDYSSPEDILNLVRAHYHTQDDKYLSAILGHACFATGANAVNLSFTTGVGVNTPDGILHVDARFSGQKPPEGLTVFGAMELEYYSGYWIYGSVFKNAIYPAINEWPNVDASTPVYPHVMHAEYMISSTMRRTCFYFGYLAYVGWAGGAE